MAKDSANRIDTAKTVVKRAAKYTLSKPFVRKVIDKTPLPKKQLKRIAKRLLQTPTEEMLLAGTIASSFNDHLASNYAEHNQLISDNKVYRYEAESKSIFERDATDPRIVAIYLPQFHPFKENDEAWGKGFTEWTNVASSYARFVGQQQPVLPADLGFYDLRLPQIMKQQIDLARKYGIYGFQFYYYWFSGKKVMDMPINTILNNKDWDFNFSICWANENWTRKWDGGSSEIIFEQKDLPDDPVKFIEDVSLILNDSRYICEGGKPVLTVYRVELLKDPKQYVDTWREYFRRNFNRELWLVGHSYDADVDPKEFGFDVTMDFTPIASLQPTLKPWVDDRKYLTQDIFDNHKLLDENWRGNVIDFRFIAKQEIDNLKNNKHYYKTISPSWSNEARRKGNDSYTFQKSSPEIFANWLDKILDFEINVEAKKSPIVFINAWNEWAEAAMIEPSQHLGHNTLLRISETLAKHSKKKVNRENFPAYGLKHATNTKLAVIIHLYYPEMWGKIVKSLAKISTPFDLYVSVPKDYSDITLGKVCKNHKNTNIVVVPNRGRDVLPFITIANRIRAARGSYEYILKLHTKKSKHRNDGDEWFQDLIDKLLPDDMTTIFETLAKESTGMIGPDGHLVSLTRHMGGNRAGVTSLVNQIIDKPYEELITDEAEHPFVGSTMFWCRFDLLIPILDTYLMASDFPAENGQIDCTTAHAVERVLGGIIHKISAKNLFLVDKSGAVSEVSNKDYIDKYKYAD